MLYLPAARVGKIKRVAVRYSMKQTVGVFYNASWRDVGGNASGERIRARLAQRQLERRRDKRTLATGFIASTHVKSLGAKVESQRSPQNIKLTGDQKHRCVANGLVPSFLIKKASKSSLAIVLYLLPRVSIFSKKGLQGTEWPAMENARPC